MSAAGGRLGMRDGLRVASVGLRARPLRAALSALGIAIGTAAIVAVLGLSSSSQAGLLAEIDRLGTNLLTLEAGQSVTGQPSKLPLEAPARITHLDGVQRLAHTALVKGKGVYRSRMIPATNTGGLQVRATGMNLLSVLNTGLARGAWLNPGTAREPVAVLGSAAAQRLGIDRIFPDQRIWLGGQWFNVAGVLESSPLEPDIDNSALIGYPAAQRYLGYISLVHGEQRPGPPSTIFVRADTGHVAEVQSLLAPTANPQAPDEVNVSQPSDALTARAAAAGAFDSLFLGLGVVALIVGAVGVANIMIISVLERRSEIGLRRALGATRSQIRTQFLAESILLAVIGGVVGVLAGAVATVVYAGSKSWAVVIPVEAWSGGIASAILIGAFAGLMPAVRASRMPPTVALRFGMRGAACVRSRGAASAQLQRHGPREATRPDGHGDPVVLEARAQDRDAEVGLLPGTPAADRLADGEAVARAGVERVVGGTGAVGLLERGGQLEPVRLRLLGRQRVRLRPRAVDMRSGDLRVGRGAEQAEARDGQAGAGERGDAGGHGGTPSRSGNFDAMTFVPEAGGVVSSGLLNRPTRHCASSQPAMRGVVVVMPAASREAPEAHQYVTTAPLPQVPY